jgi:hypothetical protein
MTYELCTLFDRNYLARGLVLYRSLVDTGADFRLCVFAMDDVVPGILEALSLPRLEVVSLDELESLDPALRAVKDGRTPVEYMWTATPAVCRVSLARDASLSEITYVDADLMFHADPRSIFDESGDSSVTIVPHRYAPRWRFYEATNGVYNVEWLTFRRTEAGIAVLDWWYDRCIEWCYAVAEDGKFGDQKYLDDWPERFEGVHVLQHVGAGLAPWNVENYTLRRDAASGEILVDGVPLVFHHYHGGRLVRRGSGLERIGSRLGLYEPVPGHEAKLSWHPGYPLSKSSRALLWRPYMEQLARARDTIRSVDPSFEAGVAEPRPRDFAFSLRTRLKSVASRRPKPRRAS